MVSNSIENNKKDKTNVDKLREYKRRYYYANRDKLLEQNRLWREANRDKVREYETRRYQTNGNKIRKYQKLHYQSNRDKVREKKNLWREANRDVYREQVRNTARKINNVKDFRFEIVNCVVCGISITDRPSVAKYCLDCSKKILKVRKSNKCSSQEAVDILIGGRE